jgi:Large extracellular alpha-helical protein
MANVRILGRMAGEALVAVVSDRLLEMKTVSIGQSGGETSFTVDASWGAGAYVSAILYRPIDANAKRMPGRAVGVRWLPLDVSDRTLSVSLGAPQKARPNQRLSVPLTLSGLGDGEKAHVTVAAVDVGILNLTNYKPPKPDEHYFGQRRLGLEIRDLYGRLIDGMQGARGQIRSGGDGGMSISGRPLSAEPVALYSGIVEVNGGRPR